MAIRGVDNSKTFACVCVCPSVFGLFNMCGKGHLSPPTDKLTTYPSKYISSYLNLKYFYDANSKNYFLLDVRRGRLFTFFGIYSRIIKYDILMFLPLGSNSFCSEVH